MVTVAMDERWMSWRWSNGGGGAVAEVVDLRLGLNNGELEFGSNAAQFSNWFCGSCQLQT